MSQSEIINILKKEQKPISAREIAKQLEIGEKLVFTTIKILLEHNEIKCIEIPTDLAKKMCHSNRRMRLYYVC